MIEERFWAKVDKRGPDECWEWTATRTKRGYGTFYINKKPLGAHRVSYELATGHHPGELFVRHKCDNPPCVNPAHLELGTHTDNMRDCVDRGRWRGGARRGTRIGENNPRAKLSVCQVEEIKRLRGHVPQRRLAERFGVSPSTVAGIQRGVRWGNANTRVSEK